MTSTRSTDESLPREVESLAGDGTAPISREADQSTSEASQRFFTQGLGFIRGHRSFCPHETQIDWIDQLEQSADEFLERENQMRKAHRRFKTTEE